MRRSQRRILLGFIALLPKRNSFQGPLGAARTTTTTTTTALASRRTAATRPTAASTSSSLSAAAAATTTTSKTYRLDGVGRTGGTGVDVTTDTGHVLSTDIPSSMGGRDEAPQPVETLLAAWMGCTQATASFVGRQLLRERRTRIPSCGGDDRRRRRRRMTTTTTREVLLLEFVAIEAVRDERGALELPVRETPSVPSRLRRISGTVRVSLVVTAASGGPASAAGDSADDTDSTTAATAKSVTTATTTEEEAEAVSFDREELEVLKEQTEARCPIANMLVESGCAMDVEWVMNES